MKHFLLIIFCCLTLKGVGQSMEEVIFPQYAFYSFNGGGAQSIPYVFRARLTGLQPSTTYFYCTKFSSVNEDPYSSGNSASIVVQPSGAFTSYNPVPLFLDFAQDGWSQLTTDAQGTYTGWFATETYFISVYEQEFQVRISLNDGMGGIIFNTIIASPHTVKAINFAGGPDDAASFAHGTAIRSTPATNGTTGNMVFLYDNEQGNGRPVAGAFIQDVVLAGTSSLYSGFYASDVAGHSKTWGTIIPNDLPNGIRRIAQYALSTGTQTGVNTSPDGLWDGLNGLVSTVNPTGLDANVIVIDGTLQNLLQNRPAQTITFAPIPDKTYGDAPFQLSATSNSGITNFTFTSSDETVASISGNTVTVLKPGTTTITASVPGNATYSRSTATRILTVNPAGQTITFAQLPAHVYGDAPFTLSATASSGLPVTFKSDNPAVAEVNGNSVTIHGAGTATITASQAGNENFPAAPDEHRSLVISPAALEISAVEKTRKTGNVNPVLTYTAVGFKYQDNVASLTTPVIISTTATTASPQGDYDIIVSGATSPNYTITFNNSILHVYDAVQTISFTLPAKTYGDAAFDPGATSSVNGTPVYISDNPAVAVVNSQGLLQVTGAGTATITASFPAAGGLPATTEDVQLTVNKKTLTITPDNKSRSYGQPDPAFTFSYNGFVNGDNNTVLSALPAASSNATVMSDAGDYIITATGAAAINYSISYETGTLTVTKAQLTARADDKVISFGDPLPAFTISYSGFVNNQDASVIKTLPLAATAATSTSGAGTYPITVSGGSADNYTFTFISGRLTINAISRSITFDPLPVKNVGDEDFDPAAQLSSGETPVYTSSNNQIASIVNGKVHITGIGNVTITAAAPANSNYNETPVADRLLVVSKGIQTISFTAVADLKSNADPYMLDVNSNAGLPVTLTLSDSLLASLDGNMLKPLQVGTLYITASQEGNDLYLAATPVVIAVNITDADNSDLKVHPALSPDGDGKNEFLSVEGIKSYPYNHVTIIDRNGMKVYEVVNYDNASRVFRGVDKNGKTLSAGTYFCVIEYYINNTIHRKTGFFELRY